MDVLIWVWTFIA